MNLQGWPYHRRPRPRASPSSRATRVAENLARFIAYCLATSLGWDLPRAVVTVVLTLALGGTVLKALRRATRRAAFDVPVAFTPDPPRGAAVTCMTVPRFAGLPGRPCGTCGTGLSGRRAIERAIDGSERWNDGVVVGICALVDDRDPRRRAAPVPARSYGCWLSVRRRSPVAE